MYVDVVGSGLLYSTKTFVFTSPTLMLNYLWVVNPVHRSSIRTIELWIPLLNHHKALPTKAVSFLAECKGLRELKLCLHVDDSNCDFVRLPGRLFNYRVHERLLRRVRDWEALRALRVRKFELRVVFKGWITGPEQSYKTLEEELKGILLMN